MRWLAFVFSVLLTFPAVGGPPELVPEPERADFVEIDKSARAMRLLRDSEVLKTYRVSLGFAPEGHKRQEGDGKTPEGRYVIDWRNPQSRFHLSLHISYPDARDRADAKARGVSPGGEIFIHGGPGLKGQLASLWRGKDWTLGCIAVTDAEIEEIWSLVPNDTPIEIRP